MSVSTDWPKIVFAKFPLYSSYGLNRHQSKLIEMCEWISRINDTKVHKLLNHVQKVKLLVRSVQLSGEAGNRHR